MLLIDEVDSFLQDRRSAQQVGSHGRNEMLTQMERFDGVLVVSLNLMERLNSAALRRFDLTVKFAFLAPAQAAELLRRRCDALGLPGPGAARYSWRCRDCGNSRPATLRRRCGSTAFAPLRLVEILRGVCSVKDGERRAVGFVH